MANWNKVGAITGIIALILSGISLYQTKQANIKSEQANKIAKEANEIAQKQFEANISISIKDGAFAYSNSWNNVYQKEIEFSPIQDKEYGATFMKDFNILIDNYGSKADSIIDAILYRNYDNTLFYFTSDSFEILQNDQPISLPLPVESDKSEVYVLRVKFYIPKAPWKASGLEFKKYPYNEAKEKFEEVGYSNFGQYVPTMGTGSDSSIVAIPNMYYQRFCLELKSKLGNRLMLPIYFNVAGTYDTLNKKSPYCTNLKNYKE